MGYWQDIKHFKPAEFSCRCGVCNRDGDRMDMAFMLALDALRARCAFPFRVASGLRCPAHNLRVSTTGEDGPHTTGHAVDIFVHGDQAFRLLAMAARFGMTGIGLMQSSSTPHTGRIVHLDDLPARHGQPRPWVWTY